MMLEHAFVLPTTLRPLAPLRLRLRPHEHDRSSPVFPHRFLLSPQPTRGRAVISVAVHASVPPPDGESRPDADNSDTSSPSASDAPPATTATEIVSSATSPSKPSSSNWMDGTLQLAFTAIIALFSMQARHQLLASLLAITSTPTFIALVYRLFSSRSKTKGLSMSLSQLASELQSLAAQLEQRDGWMKQSMSELQAQLKNPPPPPLPPAPSQQQKEALPFSQAAELRALRIRASRLEGQNLELVNRLTDADIRRTDAEHAAALAEGEVQACRNVERSLRSQVTSLELRVQRLASLEQELTDERRRADELRVEVETLLRSKERLSFSLKDAEMRASRFETLLMSLRFPASGSSSDGKDETRWSGSSDASDINDTPEGEKDSLANARFWNRELQKKIQRLVPDSLIADELRQQKDDVQQQLAQSTSQGGVTQWPLSPLDQSTPETPSAPSRIDGLPPDGGFAGGEITTLGDSQQINFDYSSDTSGPSSTTQALSPSTQGDDEGNENADSSKTKKVGAFAFSRDEFDSTKPSTESDASIESDDGQNVTGSGDDNVDLAKQNEPEVGSDESPDPETNDEQIDAESEESLEPKQPVSYLETLEKQQSEAAIAIQDNENDDISSIGSEPKSVDNSSSPLDIDTNKNNGEEESVIESDDLDNIDDSDDHASEQGEETDDAIDQVQQLIEKAKVAVKNGRQRGRSLGEADNYFEMAVSYFEEALEMTTTIGEQSIANVESDTSTEFVMGVSVNGDMHSLTEGELGIALVAWAKVNIADDNSRLKLERAIGLLKRRVEKAPRDTAALFNAGLCHSLLAATAAGPSSSSQTESDYVNAAELYQNACAMFERLLEVDPESRIACFNCALSYISLARLQQDKVNGDDENDEGGNESSVDEHKREWLQQALRLFEKALALKPGDAKATAYADECRRELQSIR